MGLFAPLLAVGEEVKFIILVKTDGLYYKQTIMSWLCGGKPVKVKWVDKFKALYEEENGTVYIRDFTENLAS